MKTAPHIVCITTLVALCCTSCKSDRGTIAPSQQNNDFKEARVEFILNNRLQKISPNDLISIRLRLTKSLYNDTAHVVMYDTAFAMLEKDFSNEMRIIKDVAIDPKKERLYIYKGFHLTYENYRYEYSWSHSPTQPFKREPLDIQTISGR
ncbi:MAG TPA: hypothetical protein VL947_01795 [Cytophagales bacterium]|nr:hypothetical protein [Cytophagales bacterium]